MVLRLQQFPRTAQRGVHMNKGCFQVPLIVDERGFVDIPIRIKKIFCFETMVHGFDQLRAWLPQFMKSGRRGLELIRGSGPSCAPRMFSEISLIESLLRAVDPSSVCLNVFDQCSSSTDGKGLSVECA